MAGLIALDILVWVFIYKRERRNWDRNMALLAGNVSVIGVNTAVVCAVVIATIVGLR